MNTRAPRWTPAVILVIAGSTHSLAGVPFGATLELSSLNGADGFVINGIDANDRSGFSVYSAGDINGDGVDDLIIGAHWADPNGINRAGESYVVFGGAGVGASGVIDLSALNGANGFVINGIDANDRSGWSVSSAGDVNGDGVAELIIGTRNADPNGINRAGESYVVFGGAGVGASGVIELLALNGTNGFIINGIDAIDRSGWSVSSAGDVNGDGVDDVIIGAYDADPNGNTNAGESYVVFGRCALAADLNGDDVVDTADIGALIVQFGTAGPGADINGDGVVDTSDLGILISAFGSTCP